MGFDLTIELHFDMCASTGKPYVWRRHTLTKQYIDINTYTIPERFRKWCQARGSHFHASGKASPKFASHKGMALQHAQAMEFCK